MSQRQVLVTLRAALADPTVGLAARAGVLADAANIVAYVPEVNVERWALTGNMRTSTQNNVAASPHMWDANLANQAGEMRDARGQYQVGFETFSADSASLEDTVSLFATALMQVFDNLREYSDANGGTVVNVEEPVSFSFGNFTGAHQSAGFIATAVIRERGSE